MYRDRVNSMSPNLKLLDPISTDFNLLKESYSTLAKAVHELRAHHSQKNTLHVCDHNRKLSNTFIAEVSARKVALPIDDPEFIQWCRVNRYAWFWHCDNLQKSPVLKLAIDKALNKSMMPHYERIVICSTLMNLRK